MPSLEFSNISLGNLMLAPDIPGPTFSAAEIGIVTNTNRSFGFAMSTDTTNILVGAYSAAKAIIYGYNGESWVKTAEFTRTGRFGFKVAIQGDWAAISDSPVSGNGSVFIYRRIAGVWGTTPHTTLTVPTNLSSAAGFGSAVAMHGNTLVVGHRVANSVGGVHVYVWNGNAWVKQGDLIAPTLADVRAGSAQNLGSEVAIQGDIIIAGGSGDTLGRGMGMAFVTKRTGASWSAPALIRPETSYSDGYGWSVAICGTTAVVGAPAGNASDGHPGRAFVYDVSGNTPVLKTILTVKKDKSELIQDPQVATADNYGWAVGLREDGNVLLVGSIARFGSRGIAYAYEKVNDKWVASAIPNSWLIGSDVAANARFGSAVGFTQGGVIVTASGSGKFYWFK